MMKNYEFCISMDVGVVEALASIACEIDGVAVGEDDYAHVVYFKNDGGKLSAGMRKALSDYITRAGKFAKGEIYEDVEGYFFGEV